MSDDFVVLTGGPGAGKSTVLDALGAVGYATSPEAGRALIRANRAIGGTWTEPELYGELMLAWEVRSHDAAAGRPGPVFFDRGVPDLVGYHRLLGRPVPPHVWRAAERYRYHRRVFLAPVWPEIFTADAERTQSLGEAERTHDCIAGAYADLGYELVELPKSDVDTRVEFVTRRSPRRSVRE